MAIEKFFGSCDIRRMLDSQAIADDPIVIDNPILWWKQQAGLTDRALARAVGVSHSTIQYLLRPRGEAGRQRGPDYRGRVGEWKRIKPSRETLKKISDYTALPYDALAAYFGVGARGRKAKRIGRLPNGTSA